MKARLKTSALLLLFALLSFLLNLNCSNTSKEKIKNEIAAKIDSIGNSFVESGKVMGISIAVAKDGEVIYNNGFGYTDSLKKNPVTNDNIFLMASISKLVGAVMIMKIVEENKLSLDNTLYDLLPDFPNQTQAKKIKLYHLISHTSGLLDYAMEIDSIYMKTEIAPSKEDYYNFFSNHDLMFEPGTQYAYSNSGFLLMGMIIEKVTGNNFQDEVDRVINKPAGTNIRLIAETYDNPNTSTYFELIDSTMQPQKHWLWIKGDGGLSATAKDLALFPFKWSDGTIISKSSFKKMCKPFILDSGIPTGYGLGVRNGTFEGIRAVGHTGGNKSGAAMMSFYPEENLSVVVFVNTDNTPDDAIIISGFVSLAVLQKDKPDIVNKEVNIKDEDLIRFTGLYGQHEYLGNEPFEIEIFLDSMDNHLYRKSSGSKFKGQKLFYMGDNEFAYESFPMDRIKFEFNNEEKPAAYKIHWNGLFQRMGFRTNIEN